MSQPLHSDTLARDRHTAVQAESTAAQADSTAVQADSTAVQAENTAVQAESPAVRENTGTAQTNSPRAGHTEHPAPTPRPQDTATTPTPHPQATTTTPTPHPQATTTTPQSRPQTTVATPQPRPQATVATPQPRPQATTTTPTPRPQHTAATPTPRPQAGNDAATAPAQSDSTALPAPKTDWSTAYPYVVYSTADALLWLPGNCPKSGRDATPAEIFGTESILIPSTFRASSSPASLTDNPVFQGFVLLLAATYAILLVRNLGDVRQLLARISRKASSADRLWEEPGNGGFLRFLNITTTIGMLFMGVMIVKYGDQLVPTSLLRLLPSGAVLGVSLLATAACAVVLLYQRFALRFAGVVTQSQPLVLQVLLLKRTYFSLAVIIALPTLLLYALCPRGTGEVLFYIIAAELAFTLLLYLKESLSLFISKKISILHWFLYLCTVEIFPVSLLCLLAMR